MAFDTYEAGSTNGRPIALYEIRWGNTRWKYTSADTDQFYPDDSVEGNRFRAIAISDGGMTQGGSSENDFTVEAQSDIPVVALFADSAPTGQVWLTVRRKHADDPADEAPVYWVGRLTNVTKDDNPTMATLRGVSAIRLLKSGGLRMTWNKNCPHCIYDFGCKVDPLEHEYEVIVQAVAGPVVTLAVATVAEEGTFTGGYAEWDRDGNSEKRGIEVQMSDTQVKLLGRAPGLAAGDTIKLYPGCDQTTSTCDEGFGNIDNNGGFFFMPEKSPFDGTQVF